MSILLLIFLLFLLIYSFLIDFYRRSWNAIPFYERGSADDVKVSVVIAVRNEQQNVSGLIDLLSSQDFNKDSYEVIVVDDHSTDDTWKLLSTRTQDNFSLVLLQLPPGLSGKKKAIEWGINRSQGELIITTDADCRMGSSWIGTFASFYRSTGAKFIAAPVTMTGPYSFRNIFQSLDFLAMQAITGASVHKHFHTMCNGANLAYEKKAFIEVNGFEGISEIPSGDDMLLMYKIYMAHPEKVHYLKSRNAIVTTPPETTWKKFIHQRIRWASKAVHYKDKKIFYVLLLTYLLNICYLVLAVAAIVNMYWLSFLLLLVLAKILIEFPFVNSAALFFGQQRLMKYFPFLQPVHILYVIIAGWLGRFGSYEWKSRTIKNKGRGKLVKQ